MTPKEKAKELVNKFLQVYDGRVPQAKKCTLICIDELLESNEKISLKDLSETMQTNDILCQLTDNAMYWQKVKQEINNL